MQENGYDNVYVVEGKGIGGGGAEMEKYFEHYKSTYNGGKVIDPMTGRKTDVKSYK